MAGSLLIIGITLFLVGTLVLAQDATSRARNWLVVVLPFTGMSYCRQHWSDVRVAVLLRVVGGFMLLFGVGALLAQYPEVLRNKNLAFMADSANELRGSKLSNVDNYANSATAMLVQLHKRDSAGLVGEISGQSFEASRVQLTQGVLSIQQGEGFIPDLEVRIIIGLDASFITSRKDIFVRPGDASVPEVQLASLEQGQSFPETRVINSGYSMELQLAPLDQNQLKGYIQLVIPGAESEYLVGEFVAYTNNLRYRNARVDLTYNDPDTLEYVAEQYLSTQYPRSMRQRVEYRDTRMQLSRNSGSTIARVYLVNGQIEDKLLELERAEIGWALKPGGVETKIVQLGSTGAGVSTAQSSSAQGKVEEPPLETSFSELESLVGTQVVVTQKDGEQHSGKIISVRRTLLQLESKVGSGMVQFSIDESEITAIKFATGRKIVLVADHAADSQNVSGSSVEATVKATTPASVSVAPAPPVEAAQSPAPKASRDIGENSAMQPYVQYRGKTVAITDTTGKSRTGQVLDVTDRELKLSVRLGSGTLEYFYAAQDIASIKEVAR